MAETVKGCVGSEEYERPLSWCHLQILARRNCRKVEKTNYKIGIVIILFRSQIV